LLKKEKPPDMNKSCTAAKLFKPTSTAANKIRPPLKIKSMPDQPSPILKPLNSWTKIARKRGCFWDNAKMNTEFSIRNIESDLSKPPYPFDTTRCVERCKEKGYRYAAVRVEGKGDWWKKDNKFMGNFRYGWEWGKYRQKYYGDPFLGATGYPLSFRRRNHRHPFRIPERGPDIGPTPVCICGNSLGTHGQVPGEICERTCDAKQVAAAYGTNLEKGRYKDDVSDQDKKKGEQGIPKFRDGLKIFDGKFDYGHFDNECNLPCPKCWNVNKGRRPLSPFLHYQLDL